MIDISVAFVIVIILGGYLYLLGRTTGYSKGYCDGLHYGQKGLDEFADYVSEKLRQS